MLSSSKFNKCIVQVALVCKSFTLSSRKFNKRTVQVALVCTFLSVILITSILLNTSRVVALSPIEPVDILSNEQVELSGFDPNTTYWMIFFPLEVEEWYADGLFRGSELEGNPLNREQDYINSYGANPDIMVIVFTAEDYRNYIRNTEARVQDMPNWHLVDRLLSPAVCGSIARLYAFDFATNNAGTVNKLFAALLDSQACRYTAAS